MSNILFIAYDYPPILSPESIQVQRRALSLANSGHNIFILSSHEAPAFEFIDDSLLEKHENIKIFRTKKPLFEKGINLFYKFFDLTDRKLWWKNLAFEEAKKIINNFKIDILYTHSTPLVDHLVGLRVKELYVDMQWIAHLSDPWTLNPYKKYRFTWQFKVNREYEKRVLKLANIVTVTSNKTKELFICEFPCVKGKIKVLPHTFDKKLFEKKCNKNSKKVIVHTGNVYGLRTIKYLLEALRELDIDFEFRFYGKIKKEEFELIDKYGLSDKVKICSQIPYLESLKVISEADYLLLVDAPLENSPFFPSKLADYIGAMKPIIALTPRNSASVEILEHIDNSEHIASSESKEEIILILEKLKQDKVKLSKNIDFYSMDNLSLLKDVFEK